MSNKMEWSPPAAQSREELQDALFFAASGLKTQVLTSSVLGEDDLRAFKSRLSYLADTVHGLQGKIRLGS